MQEDGNTGSIRSNAPTNPNPADQQTSGKTDIGARELGLVQMMNDAASISSEEEDLNRIVSI